ncbi:HsdM family class I SAM-dependent methyltransferase [Cylindrospermum sp. FACHB-282]|uniref:HsdM family class I SAM-dependent methyltransferase n=1 Tax=Cylindrospermum sp. FACHB-282 TaxID=2692794 RepID=UPI001686920B|nr:N-6 DNA methylase [Cylindrospermum sp. FACHB-282]MBD2387493.1 N-6 DNA methylase [Cylindrospermum sp. FACHB-282]
MSSNIAANQIYQRVMEHTGFYRHGVPTTGVTEAEDIRKNLEKLIKYSAVINPEQINATAIYELSGSPCIYFTQLNEPNPTELAKLHKLSWNHGLAPMLWVITPDEVLLYNSYSQPREQDEIDPNRNLIERFKTTESDLKRMNKYASRLQIESGKFWQWEKAKKINRQQRVDSVLVKDLNDAEKELTKDQKLDRQFAHALLIRSVFIAYLQDRGILNQAFFSNRFGVESFNTLLNNKLATYNLFEWLQTIFNGDLFPVSPEEKNAIDNKHLKIAQSLIGGVETIATGQQRLWRFYDFKVIPIELISSIYESFIYATDAKTAKENSTHYTPINLVDLVLSEVFRELDGDAKVLDLSCGSGVFLVESLRRLVVKRCTNGEIPTRRLIRETLYNQIFGVDIEPKAVQIAAFSLYLTALELDYELEENRQLTDDLKFEKLIGKNLFTSDVFNEEAEFNKIETFAQKQFHAIVGNPPWTKPKSNKSPEQYCKRKRPESGYSGGYPTAYGTPPDQAFLWRIGDFANDKSCIGLILHGKPFFSNHSAAKKAKESLLMRYKPKVIVNLSKLRLDDLFPNAKAPAMILIAEGKRSEQRDYFYFVCPDRSVDFQRHGIVEIGAEYIKKLPVFSTALDPDMLKLATWGSARDMSLLQKLRSFSSIRKIADNELKNGFKNGNHEAVPHELIGKKWLYSGQMPKYQMNIDDLAILPYHRMEASRKPEIYKAPLVIISQSIDENQAFSAFSQEDIVYTQKYCGISFPTEKVDIAHYLNGVINSSLISYFLFLTASSWGIEREEVTKQDLKRICLPQLNKNNERLITKIIEIESTLRESPTKSVEKDLKKQLDKAVFDLYDLNDDERVLVEDTTQITIDLYMNREKSTKLREPKISELEAYALHFMSVIEPFFDTLKERSIAADIFDIANTPLQVVKFRILPYSGREQIVQTVQAEDLITVLKSIAKQLPPKFGDRVFTRRNLKVYVGENIYIIKPCQLRYWSRSAGLNDADSVLLENLRMN